MCGASVAQAAQKTAAENAAHTLGWMLQKGATLRLAHTALLKEKREEEVKRLQGKITELKKEIERARR